MPHRLHFLMAAIFLPAATALAQTSVTTLSPGQVLVAYDSGVIATSTGSTAVSCNLTGSLPPGLSCVTSSASAPGTTAALIVTSAGVRGTPTAAGTYAFAIFGRQFSLTIASPTTLKSATVGVAYDSGIIRSVFRACAPTGTIPPGLACYVSSGGGVRGTPSEAGTFTFTLDGQQSFSLTVNQGQTVTVNVNALAFTAVTNGQSQTLTIQITTSGGSVPFVAGVSLTSPASRQWLNLSANSGVAPTTLRATASPTGLSPGTYTASITLSVSSNAALRSAPFDSTGSTVVIPVTLTVSSDTLTFYYVLNGPTPAPKTLAVNPVGAANAAISTFAAVNQPTGGSWLSVTPGNGTAPLALAVSVNPTGLAPGSYTGSLAIFVANSPADSRNVGVNLLVLANPDDARAFTFQIGGGEPAPQALSLSGNGGATINFATEISTDGGAWLAVEPTTGATPVTLTLSATPSGMTAGVYKGLLAVVDPTTPLTPFTVLVTLTVTGSSAPTRQVISHLADGGGWRTTIILVNLDTQPAQFSLAFHNDDGTAYAMPVSGQAARSTLTDTIPVGGSRTIETAGTASLLATGWAEVISSQKISGTAIFRSIDSGQEAAVPLALSGGNRLLLPYDTSPGLALGVGFANGSTGVDGSPTITWKSQEGRTIGATPGVSLPAANHTSLVASNPSTAGADQRGVLEITSAASLYALGIRFNGAAFTSIEALGPQERGSRTISHVADGEGWRTTIVLVNVDSTPAAVTLNFFGEDGKPMNIAISGRGVVSSLTDAIPVGGSRTYETAGATFLQGWAQVATSQAVSGTAIFRAVESRQEAAVPLLTQGGSRLLVPYDTTAGLNLGIALANPSTSNDVTVDVTIRNEQGQTVATDRKTIPAHGHTAYVFSNPSQLVADQRGVVELSAPGATIFALGIRANARGAFTSIRALGN